MNTINYLMLKKISTTKSSSLKTENLKIMIMKDSLQKKNWMVKKNQMTCHHQKVMKKQKKEKD